jgi:drug/metabolite transporter (DMT)-like permease
VLTVVTLVAFAANSVLCRLALGERSVDAASFTTIRLVSGAVVLALLARAGGHRLAGSWRSAVMLFLYAAAFSFAYLTLAAGTGALLLFGAVQLTMILSALVQGERPRAGEWAGLGIALAGLVWLVLPGLAAPSPVGAALMILAGVGWGFYSLLGRRASDPLADTAGNFVRAVPLGLAVSVVAAPALHLTPRGVGVAVASGALASGLGYVVWYAALRRLTATRAATVQLAVPAIAAAGGVLFLGETLTGRLVAASVLVLGGIGLAVARRSAARPSAPRR